MKKKSIIILIALVLVVICVTASGCFTKKVTEDVTLTSANFIFEKVVGEVIDSTVTISCTTSGGTSGGAGVVVSADGYVLTNNHVVKDSTTKTADIRFANESASSEAPEYLIFKLWKLASDSAVAI